MIKIIDPNRGLESESGRNRLLRLRNLFTLCLGLDIYYINIIIIIKYINKKIDKKIEQVFLFARRDRADSTVSVSKTCRVVAR